MEYCKIFSGLMAHMSPHVKSFSQPQWRHSGGTVTAQWRHSGGTVATGKTQYFALVSNLNFQIKKNIFAALQGPLSPDLESGHEPKNLGSGPGHLESPGSTKQNTLQKQHHS